MIRKHEELSEEYENIQKELDTFKSKLNHIDYFKWLEEELGHNLDKDTIINYAKFCLDNNKSWQREHNDYANKYENVIGFSLLVFVIVFEILWVGFSRITNIFILLGVGTLVPFIVIFSVAIMDDKRTHKQQALIKDKYIKQKESYLANHHLSNEMQQLIELSLSDINAYYKNKFNDNDLFMSMYYRIYNKRDDLSE